MIYYFCGCCLKKLSLFKFASTMRASAALGKATQGLFALVGTSLAGKIEMKHQVNSSLVSYGYDGMGRKLYAEYSESLLFPQGYFTFDETTGKAVPHYFLRDHLGSVRVVTDGDGTAEQVNHYYAFGGVMAGSTGAGIQSLKYNGKELERTNGLNLSDYGARWYDAAAPSWLTPDPLAEKDPGISPYV